MTDDFDQKISQMLSGWGAPAPSSDAIARIMAAAATPVSTPVRAFPRRRTLFMVPALAAAMAVGIVTMTPHETLPRNEPVLQQSALSVFSITNSNADTGELP